MSTQKNEHNPDNLTPEQYGAPEWRLLNHGEPQQLGDEWWNDIKQCWAPNDESDVGFSYNHHAARRRITPPTDTTGSGREGETVDHRHNELMISKCWEIIATERKVSLSMLQRRLRIGFVEASLYIGIMQNRGWLSADLTDGSIQILRGLTLGASAVTVGGTPETDAALKSKGSFSAVERGDDWNYVEPSFARQLERQRDAALAQVEALRRDGERDGINYPVTVDAKLLRSLIWTGDAIVREPNQGRLAAWRELREKVCAQMKCRAAIDSAQRQEKP